jgi:hypothetical protein
VEGRKERRKGEGREGEGGRKEEGRTITPSSNFIYCLFPVLGMF